MFHGARTAAIIPALDEERTIGSVVAAVDRDLVDEVIVADNGSRDHTAINASAAGATVVGETRRGYGSACLAGIRAAGDAELLVFLDGDGSDDPQEIPLLLNEMHQTTADLVIGSRTIGAAEPGALTTTQRFGNALTCSLVRLLWGARYTDLGPFRAIRRAALDRLEMGDPDFGWTIEMQVKAAQQGLRVVEVPVACRLRRGGRSKVSGDIVGSLRAGQRILGYVARAKLRETKIGSMLSDTLRSRAR
jgi:glycosyltransferase involved in cell wall biosynthesis